MTLRLSPSDHARLVGERTGTAPRKPAASRVRGGHVAHDRGAALERDLLLAARPPWVHIQRTSPPWRLVRGADGELRPVVEEVGVPDVHAVVSGRAWVFDCKATGSERWELRQLKEEQRRHLRAAAAAGAMAGVLVRWDATMEVRWIGVEWFDTVERQPPGGRRVASLTAEEAAAVGRVVRGLRFWEAA